MLRLSECKASVKARPLRRTGQGINLPAICTGQNGQLSCLGARLEDPYVQPAQDHLAIDWGVGTQSYKDQQIWQHCNRSSEQAQPSVVKYVLWLSTTKVTINIEAGINARCCSKANTRLNSPQRLQPISYGHTAWLRWSAFNKQRA